jgi:hypothetical protein
MSTTEQLRDDIDSGRTRDKVAAIDPAAAPLGTDEEAAGTPVPAQAVDMARTREVSDESSPRWGWSPLVYMTMLACVMIVLMISVLFFLGGG